MFLVHCNQISILLTDLHNISNMIFHKNSSSASHIDMCGWTDITVPTGTFQDLYEHA